MKTKPQSKQYIWIDKLPRIYTILFADPCCDPGRQSHEKAMKSVPREGHAKGGASMWPQYQDDCRSRKGVCRHFAATDPGFPSGSQLLEGRRQTTVCPIFFRKLHENEKNKFRQRRRKGRLPPVQIRQCIQGLRNLKTQDACSNIN